MEQLRSIIRRKPWVGAVLFIVTAVLVFALGLLAANIMERRTETLYLEQRRINIEQLEPRNEIWGIAYPRQYQSYQQTKDTSFVSRYNGARNFDMLERYPNLVVLWAGYAFATDYTQPRGHYYANDDVTETLRTGTPVEDDDGPQPATCWTCKSADVPRMMNKLGVEEFYDGTWGEKGPHMVANAIGCVDCHDEETMSLKITRPALIEAFERRGEDITQASHQEMRSLVCAQCHVEYYFDKERFEEGVPYLTFPWDNGLNIEDIEAYFDSIGFTDWTHELSRAPMIKAQHPDYELYTAGIHAKRGVTCADCHMPYRSEGGVKFTDHKIQSPLNNVSASCQVCHRQSEKELISNVYSNQDKVMEVRLIAEDLLAKLHIEAKFAWDLGASKEQMEDILQDIRHAQWRWDFSAASHGASAHAPTETLRLLGTSIDLSHTARNKLARLVAELGHRGPIPVPDISTKEKAQQYIGIPIEKLENEKEEWLETVVPQWIRKAQERQAQWPQYKATDRRPSFVDD
ncbi:ammonia-forming cytochrome c nitrite reductase [Cytophagaceae bacterium ABcell3]|nr:ammonia-forming cytochrome c nitrite reductase [Cytophagaceae bacterium ABcell3]